MSRCQLVLCMASGAQGASPLLRHRTLKRLVLPTMRPIRIEFG